MKPVSRADSKTLPMPEHRVTVARDRLFLADELVRIRQGHEPRAMEDKWFLFFEAPWLYGHRSWTGTFVYRGRLEEEAGGARLVEVEIGPCRYAPSLDDPEHAAAFFEWLIDVLILGRDVPRPNREGR
ncbi:hypothetical protein ACFL6C_11440 [Myxococcota bacterium]